MVVTQDGNVLLHKGANSQTSVFISPDGNLGIGKSNPQEKLEVNGLIHAKAVEVDLDNWPDYVFDKAYNLVRLREIASYVNKHGHLPEIPSAREIEAEGLNLGEMDKLLLKKIEELTLHLIEKDEQISVLTERLDALEARQKTKN